VYAGVKAKTHSPAITFTVPATWKELMS